MSVSKTVRSKVSKLLTSSATSNGTFVEARKSFWAVDVTSAASQQILALRRSAEGNKPYLYGRVNDKEVYLQLTTPQYEELMGSDKVTGYPILANCQVWAPVGPASEEDKQYLISNGYKSAADRLGKHILKAEDIKMLSKAQLEAYNEIKGTTFS